jgi:hypothetical protein
MTHRPTCEVRALFIEKLYACTVKPTLMCSAVYRECFNVITHRENILDEDTSICGKWQI